MEKIQKSTNLQTISSRNPLWYTIINPTVIALASLVDNKTINKSFFISWGHFDKKGFSTITLLGNGVIMSTESVIKTKTFLNGKN